MTSSYLYSDYKCDPTHPCLFLSTAKSLENVHTLHRNFYKVCVHHRR